MNEIWKDIPDYEGFYQASSLGRIRSVDRYVTQQGRGKAFTGLRKGRIIKQRLQNAGYFLVWLSKQGKIRAHTVHRLVAASFIDNPENMMDINHKDGDKKNNSVHNLEWCTRSQNIKHSYEKLNHKTNGKAVRCIELDIIYSSAAEASRERGISACGIRHVLTGRAKTAGGYRWEYA